MTGADSLPVTTGLWDLCSYWLRFCGPLAVLPRFRARWSPVRMPVQHLFDAPIESVRDLRHEKGRI